MKIDVNDSFIDFYHLSLTFCRLFSIYFNYFLNLYNINLRWEMKMVSMGILKPINLSWE